MTVLDPQSPVFTTPNAIGPADWDGWVQERGLYFAHTWAPEYTPLLSMADPGGPEQKGGLLVARARQGPLRLHGPRLLPPASGRRARRVPTARQPARVEVSAEPEEEPTP